MKLFPRSRSIKSVPSSEHLVSCIPTRKVLLPPQASTIDPVLITTCDSLLPTGGSSLRNVDSSLPTDDEPSLLTAMDYESDDSDEEMEIVWSRSRYEIGKRDDLDITGGASDDKYGSFSTSLSLLKSNSDECLWRSLDETDDEGDPFSYDKNESDWCEDEDEQNVLDLRDDRDVKRVSMSSPRKKNTSKSAKYRHMILAKRDAQTLKSLGDQSETDNENEECEMAKATIPSAKVADNSITGAILGIATVANTVGAVATTKEDSRSIQENIPSQQIVTVPLTTMTKAMPATVKTFSPKEPAPVTNTTTIRRNRVFGCKKIPIKAALTVLETIPTVPDTKAKVISPPFISSVKPEPPARILTSKQESTPYTNKGKSESSITTPKKSNVAAQKIDINFGWIGTKPTFTSNNTTPSPEATRTVENFVAIHNKTTSPQSSTPTEKAFILPNVAAPLGTAAVVTAVGVKASRRFSIKERLSCGMTRNSSIRNAATTTTTTIPAVTANATMVASGACSVPSEVTTSSTASTPLVTPSFDELLNSSDDDCSPTTDSTTLKSQGESVVDEFLNSIEELFNPNNDTVPVAEKRNARSVDNTGESNAFVNRLRASIVCAPVVNCITTCYGHTVPQKNTDTTVDHPTSSSAIDFFGCQEEMKFLKELFQEEHRGEEDNDKQARSLDLDGVEDMSSRNARDSIPIESIEFLTPPESETESQEMQLRSKKELAVDTTLNAEEIKSPAWFKNPPPKSFGRFLRRGKKNQNGTKKPSLTE